MLNRVRRWTNKTGKRPYSLFQIEPTMLCNLECVMCPWTEMRQPGSEMSAATFARIAEFLPLAAGVDFTGTGEGTLHPRLVEMVRTAKAAGCTAGFSTNGVWLDEALALGLIDAGLDWISFSFDAATPEMYERIRQGSSFQIVTENILRLGALKRARRRALPKTMLVFVMMRENYQQLPDYIDLADRLGVRQVIAKNLDVILRHSDDARRVFSHSQPARVNVESVVAEAQVRAQQRGIALRLYAQHPVEQAICEHNPLQNLFFNWQGYVSPCITLAYAEERIFRGKNHRVPCLRFGNINEAPLPALWAMAGYAEFRQPYLARTRRQRHALMSQALGGEAPPSALPSAPEPCRTCYYLYGI
jgi:MoaA/NifB/PqqE/SkfB family radical SAM enzyme